MAGELVQFIDTMKLVLLYGWPFILLLILFAMKMKWKAWPVDVVIIEKRGDNLIKTNDRAGRYVDKFTGVTGYRLQKAKDTIPVVDYNWVLHNSFKATTVFDKFVNLLRGDIGTIFLYRYGSKQYKPVKIIDKSTGKAKVINQEIKNADGSTIIVPIYQLLDPRDKLSVLDFEVVDWDNMNFMVQEQRAVIERMKKQGDWIKQIAVPLVIFAVTAIVCIIMIKYSYDYSISLRSAGNPTPTAPATAPNIPIVSNVIPAQ